MELTKDPLHHIVFPEIFRLLEKEIERGHVKKVANIVSYKNAPALKSFLLDSMGGDYSEPEKSGKDAVFYEWIPPHGSNLFFLGKYMHYNYYMCRDSSGSLIFSIRDGGGELGETGKLPEDILTRIKGRIGFIKNHSFHGIIWNI